MKRFLSSLLLPVLGINPDSNHDEAELFKRIAYVMVMSAGITLGLVTVAYNLTPDISVRTPRTIYYKENCSDYRPLYVTKTDICTKAQATACGSDYSELNGIKDRLGVNYV